jgi:RNA-directed DNA polymerase
MLHCVENRRMEFLRTTGLRGVREAAKKDKRLQFTALLHHVSVLLLESSFYALKRDAAPGVDGVTWTEYETGLGERLKDLHSRVHRGTYRAQPSKRAYIPKADGRQRPLGIAALEDKIVQYAVMTVLNQIYEEDFLGCGAQKFHPPKPRRAGLRATHAAPNDTNASTLIQIRVSACIRITRCEISGASVFGRADIGALCI